MAVLLEEPQERITGCLSAIVNRHASSTTSLFFFFLFFTSLLWCYCTLIATAPTILSFKALKFCVLSYERHSFTVKKAITVLCRQNFFLCGKNYRLFPVYPLEADFQSIDDTERRYDVPFKDIES